MIMSDRSDDIAVRYLKTVFKRLIRISKNMGEQEYIKTDRLLQELLTCVSLEYSAWDSSGKPSPKRMLSLRKHEDRGKSND